MHVCMPKPMSRPRRKVNAREDCWHVASGERTPSAEPSVTPRASPKEKSSRSQPSVAIKVALVDAIGLVVTLVSKQPTETSDVATACRCRKPYQRALHAVSIPAQLKMQGLPPRLEVRVQASVAAQGAERAYLEKANHANGLMSVISVMLKISAGGACVCTACVCTAPCGGLVRQHGTRGTLSTSESTYQVPLLCAHVTLLPRTWSGCVCGDC